MSAEVVLRGVAWNHSRGITPLVATAQRFGELNPGVEIHWTKRSLHEFGHAGLGPLAKAYDLLIIDHPMMGLAAETGALLDLCGIVDRAFLDNLAADSVGRSYESYRYEGQLYALPVDAAAPAACFRPDLLDRAGESPPAAWDDVLRLARKGLVVMPGFPVDVFLNLMGLCVSAGAEVGGNPEEWVDGETALEWMEALRELASLMPDEIYQWNPIAMYEQMAADDQYAYCPFAYSYSNYSRQGYAKHPLRFANPARIRDGRPMCTVLGGTGMAISARCSPVKQRLEPALEYLTCLAGWEWQRTLYGRNEGQPARLSAWQDETLNRVADGFFERTLESAGRAYVRPRYAGYIGFQERAGAPVVEYLRAGGSARDALDKVNVFYRRSRR